MSVFDVEPPIIEKHLIKWVKTNIHSYEINPLP